MLDVEAQYVTVVKRHVSESTEDAAGDAWVEVRIDPEVYRRLEDAVKLVSEGLSSSINFEAYLTTWRQALAALRSCS